MSFYPQARSTFSTSFPDAFLAIQPAKNWTGAEPLPGRIADYYSSVGPVDVELPWTGRPLELPSLRNLWPLQAGFRYDPKTQARYQDWPDAWWVVARSKPNIFIFNSETETVGRAWRERLRWKSHDVFSGMDEFAAVIPAIAALIDEKREVLLDADGNLTAEGSDEMLLALFDLCKRDIDKAEGLINDLGWAQQG